MTLEIGKIVVHVRTGNLYLIFEPGRMVRIDEPLEIVTFGERLSEGYFIIELPVETMKTILDRYKAMRVRHSE